MAAGAPAGKVTREDPYRVYNFEVQVHGVTEGHFTHCTGLGVSVEPIAYREAGANQIVRQLPGRVEYSEVTLRYGVTSSEDFWKWMKDTASGKIDRRNVSILLRDTEGGRELTRWNLIEAWPSAWRGAPLDALANDVAIESLTLVYESLERG